MKESHLQPTDYEVVLEPNAPALRPSTRTKFLRGRLTDGRLGAAEFGGVWHRYVTEILLRAMPARRIVGALTEPHAVRRLLAALGLAAEPPPGQPVPAA